MAKHWSERLSCRCGMIFRSYGAEARHRHNFPSLCRQPKRRSATLDIEARDRDGRPVVVADGKELRP